MRCRYCGRDVETQITMIPSILSFLAVVLLLIMTGLVVASILLIPTIVFTAFKSHKCPLCKNVLGKSTKIFNYWLDTKDNVVPLSIGTDLAIVVSKRLLINFGVVILIIVIIVHRLKYTDISAGTPIETSWQEFLEQCGADKFDPQTIYLDQKLRNRWRRCEYTFLGRTFQNWKGHVIRVEDHRLQSVSYFKAISILIKMSPPEFQDHPDLVLNINYDKVADMEDRLYNLEHGTEIVFNATLKSLMLTRANFLHLVPLL